MLQLANRKFKLFSRPFSWVSKSLEGTHTANIFLNSLSRTLNGRFVTCNRFGPSLDKLPIGEDVVELDVEDRLARACCCVREFLSTCRDGNVLCSSICGEVMIVLISAFLTIVL